MCHHAPKQEGGWKHNIKEGLLTVSTRKRACTKCGTKHVSPTGAKCTVATNPAVQPEAGFYAS